MITFTIYSVSFELFSLLLGALVGTLVTSLLFWITTRRITSKQFLPLRERLREINTHLIEASKQVHSLDETLDEVGKYAKD